MNRTIAFDCTKMGNPLGTFLMRCAARQRKIWPGCSACRKGKKDLNFVSVHVDHALYSDEDMIDRKSSIC